ncbi:MAG: FHA domain-containing protein, partial [Candidatus Limnocylindrales bacterium]
MGRLGLLVDGRPIEPAETSLVIGRLADADIRIDDERVSRRHAILERGDNAWTVRDISRNGMWCDGERVTVVEVDRAREIRLGAANGVLVRLVPVPEPATDAIPSTPAPGSPTAIGRLTAVHALAPRRMIIGRAPDADIVIDDLRVSRRHAELQLTATGADLVDAGSQNGTFVNGDRVQRANLAIGDLVGIGGITLRFTGERLEAYEAGDAAWLLARGLGVRIGAGRRLLDDVSFALPPSSLLAIAGPSGAGKTTLLQALTGVRPAQDGTVIYQGRDLYASLGELRGRMGFVPQSDILHYQLTVRQALRYAAELRFPADVDARTRDARVDEVMEELGLAERAGLRIGRLSGGQRKRTSVAVELLTRPSLLFLDEPTSGLDPANEANLMDLLRDLAQGGRTVVVVTHSLQSLDRADRLLLLAPGGRLAFYGPPAEAEPYFVSQGVEAGGLDRAFRALDERRDIDWAPRFAATPLYALEVAAPIAEVMTGSTTPRTVANPTAPTPWLRQLSVLVRRFLAVIASDRATLAILVLQAPIFGGLFLLLFRGNVLSTAYPIEAAVLLWLLALGATWLGTSNAIREIVKELPIYEREHGIGLSTSAYVASKAAVLGVITVVQAALMVLIAMAPQTLPPQPTPGYDELIAGLAAGSGVVVPISQFDGRGALLGVPMPELILGAALTGLAAMALALLASAALRAA